MKGSIKAAALLQRELGDWWQDDRRHWCAYCGIPMRQKFGLGRPIPDTRATRDHLVPKAHGSGGLTIPACHGCNRSKGALSLAEFLCSQHFAEVRRRKHRNKWPIHDLLLASALASLQQAEKLLNPPVANETANYSRLPVDRVKRSRSKNLIKQPKTMVSSLRIPGQYEERRSR
ncbi:HNH endonuclease [Rhizobium bangladeshense]|uniref:HNH endonuclease n=1 Tax=Rhizobium bangladeshense TaxID=1138189 RepID=UPI001A983870|nr:hypothetical protein [Rhizobium bangladeshense]MBX4932687.1 hypothetical protein [Rhizobium bangladeshense]QSY89040.1 hypothetical protein J2J98_02445 [Rhizobium bangladeshense]